MRNVDYERFMRVALEEARISLKEGNKGFGAVLVKDGKAIVRAHDTEIEDSDPTAHAEINAIKKASKKHGKDLTGCVIISTHEPCPMCTGAIIWAKISEIVYGCSVKDTIKLGRTMVDLSCKVILEKSPWKMKIVEGILKEECLKLYDEETRRLVTKLRAAMDDGWKRIEKELIERRIEWFEENKDNIFRKVKGTDVEKAYQLLLMKIGIKEGKAPIIEKSQNRVVFHSKNFCAVLEACKILELDTRNVCKTVFEKPSDELIKKINSRLRFIRNYKCIRPYTTYCEEIIELEN